MIGEVFSQLTASEVVSRLDEAQIANARMNSVREFIDHPQLEARDRWREVDSPAGPLRALLPPVQMSGLEYPMGPIPALGAQTDAILSELGYDDDAIREMHGSGVV